MVYKANEFEDVEGRKRKIMRYDDLNNYDKWKESQFGFPLSPYCPICGKLGHIKCGRESR